MSKVLVNVQEQMYLIKVSILPQLPVDMILGKDCPVLINLVSAHKVADIKTVNTPFRRQQHNVGPDPTHIWYVWIPHGPVVGRM